MPKRGKGGKSAAQSKLVAHNFLPNLARPSDVIGEFIEIRGSDWGGCPASEKEKWFKCIVRQFDAVHDFPGGTKSAGFEVQEMGVAGEGSLEPGVASGDVFWVQYPNPFLRYFYKAHPERLPDDHPDKPRAVATATAEATAAAATEGAATEGAGSAAEATKTASGMPVVRQDAPVYSFFSLESDELCGKPGPNHGKRQQVWRCAIKTASGDCCNAQRTMTFEKPNRVPQNSNLKSHIESEAKKCEYHAAALGELNESSKHQVKQADGSYTTVHTFEEAFPHHVDYVAMVATGEISANTGTKPAFRKYVTGERSSVPSKARGSVCGVTVWCARHRLRAACDIPAPRDAAPYC
jgi:hypothetical protein